MQHTLSKQNKVKFINCLKNYWFTCLLVFFAFKAQTQVNHRTFIQQARFELSEERFLDALRSLNTAIQVRPDLFEPWFLRGVAKYNLSDYHGAEKDFSEALRLHPLHIRSYHYRGLSRIRLANFYDALQDFRKALDFDPYDAGLRMALGDALLGLNLPKDALDEYSMALTIEPRNADAWTKKAIANRTLGRMKEALSDLRQAVHYNTFSLDARLRLAMLKAETGHTTEALEDFEVLKRIHSEEPIVFFQLSLLQLQIGDTTAALQSLEMVNRLEPSNTLATYNRALLLSHLKEYQKAIWLFDEVLARQPSHILSWYNRGVAHLKTGAYARAESDFSRAIVLFPGFVAAWLNRAEAREGQKNHIGAAQDRETAARLLDDQYVPPPPDSPFRNDSLWFNRIMRLESEFARPGVAEQTQYESREVTPFGLFMLVVARRDHENKLRRDGYCALLEGNFPDNLIFGFVEASKLVHHSILDTIPLQATGQRDLHLFVWALQEYGRGNYNNAFDAFNKVDPHSALFNASRINMVAALYQAELLKATMQLPLEVSIATSKPQTNPAKTAYQPNFDQAIQLLQNILSKKAASAYPQHNLGYLLLRSGSYHPSIDAFSMALELDPSLGESWFTRALVLLFVNENKLACHDLSKAGEQGIAQAYALIRQYCTRP